MRSVLARGGQPPEEQPKEKNLALLNLPEKDPITGKIKIELAQGSKESDRMDINKLIEEANKAKRTAETQKTTTPVIFEAPKIVSAKGGNIPKPPPIPNIVIPGLKKK